MKSDFADLWVAVVIPVLVVILLACLIMAAPSVDEVLKNY
jgi:hypothetical protein